MTSRYDVIIVGARCAGSPLAVMLARQGLAVALLDKAHFPSDVPSTSAFQSNGVEVLARIGVLDDVMGAGAAVLRRAVVTATSGAFTGAIDPEVYGTALGMRRTSMDQILVQAARAAGADVRTGCAVAGVLTDDGRVVGVLTRDGQQLRAPLVVGADGRHSTIAAAVGAREYCTRAPGRLPTWAFYDGVDGGDTFYFGAIGRRATRGSAAYLGLPVDGGFLVSVNVPMAEASSFLTDRYRNFDTELARFPQLSDAVAGGRRVGPLRVYRNWHSYFRTSAGPGWVLAGDAGNFKDYSLGQGQSDAFRQVEQLAPHIARGLDSGGDLDAETAAWWQWRDRDGWQMYWANCLLGEPYLPDAIFDAAKSLTNDDPELATHLAGVFNKSVSPLRLLTPRQLLRVAPAALAGIAAQAAGDRGRTLFALADLARFTATLALNQPRNRLRRIPSAPLPTGTGTPAQALSTNPEFIAGAELGA
ncbi:FAD-dependent oxidoreductase [Nocardia asteroides]|uniref:FAD-dependent oxidoreductase n=1 Tax=Nocardia asteroides TaxID=1824 RepID=UPI0037C67AE4